MSLGADGIELDVRRSLDGVVVVHHDATLDRTTSLRGPLAARSAAELAGVAVPSLSEILVRYPALPVIIDLKLDEPAFAADVIRVVGAAGAMDHVCLGGFGSRARRAARAIEPRIATSASREEVRWTLYRSWMRMPRTRAAYDGYQVPEFAGRTRVVSRRFISEAHRAGLGVQVWTVDTEEEARRLLAWGADAMITDRPDRIVPVVAEGSWRGTTS